VRTQLFLGLGYSEDIFFRRGRNALQVKTHR
jgi:hypothetical protein